jgi:hypothetical protein
MACDEDETRQVRLLNIGELPYSTFCWDWNVEIDDNLLEPVGSQPTNPVDSHQRSGGDG